MKKRFFHMFFTIFTILLSIICLNDCYAVSSHDIKELTAAVKYKRFDNPIKLIQSREEFEAFFEDEELFKRLGGYDDFKNKYDGQFFEENALIYTVVQCSSSIQDIKLKYVSPDQQDKTTFILYFSAKTPGFNGVTSSDIKNNDFLISVKKKQIAKTQTIKRIQIGSINYSYIKAGTMLE